MSLNKETKQEQEVKQDQLLCDIEQIWIQFSFFYTGCHTE